MQFNPAYIGVHIRNFTLY